MERRLAAILAADVVGYGRLMEQDEATTFERLCAHRKELFEPEIQKHHGRIFKLMGDGLLAEFGSVVDAVECAVLLQREMAERNKGVSNDQRIDVRMGAHVGDVIIEGDDRHGDAVNIASRLQQVAEAGGICISGSVADHIKHKVALRFESRGEVRLKNVTEPVLVYRVALDLEPAGSNRRRRNIGRWAAAAAGLLLAGAGLGYVGWPRGEKPSSPQMPSSVETSVPPAATASGNPTVAALSASDHPASPPTVPSDEGIPVIVVLPFQDLTGSQPSSGGAVDLDKLGKGIAEEFGTDLAKFPDFDVVSSSSSFAYVGKPVPEIVKATGATFVIEGSVRKTGGNLMVTLQLIRGSTDRHLAIIQVEETVSDPVVTQTAVVTKLRDELGGMSGVLRNELNRIAENKIEADLTEYDYYVLGHIHMFRAKESEVSIAGEIWRKGLDRFPDSVLLRCKLSFAKGWNGDNKEARRLVDEAIAGKKRNLLDEWYVHYAQAVSYANTFHREQAAAEARIVLDMAPYDAMAHMDMSWVFRVAGMVDESVDAATYGITHDPNPRWWYFRNVLNAYQDAGRVKELGNLAETEIHKYPKYEKWWRRLLFDVYSSTGRTEEAGEQWERLKILPEPPES